MGGVPARRVTAAVSRKGCLPPRRAGSVQGGLPTPRAGHRARDDTVAHLRGAQQHAARATGTPRACALRSAAPPGAAAGAAGCCHPTGPAAPGGAPAPPAPPGPLSCLACCCPASARPARSPLGLPGTRTLVPKCAVRTGRSSMAHRSTSMSAGVHRDSPQRADVDLRPTLCQIGESFVREIQAAQALAQAQHAGESPPVAPEAPTAPAAPAASALPQRRENRHHRRRARLDPLPPGSSCVFCW